MSWSDANVESNYWLLGEEALYEFRVHAYHHDDCLLIYMSFLPLLSASGHCCRSEKLSFQEIGVAKLSGFRQWLSIHPLVAGSEDEQDLDSHSSSHKMIIFAHHHKVLDGIQVRSSLSQCILFSYIKWSESTCGNCYFGSCLGKLLKPWGYKDLNRFYPMTLHPPTTCKKSPPPLGVMIMELRHFSVL